MIYVTRVAGYDVYMHDARLWIRLEDVAHATASATGRDLLALLVEHERERYAADEDAPS